MRVLVACSLVLIAACGCRSTPKAAPPDVVVPSAPREPRAPTPSAAAAAPSAPPTSPSEDSQPGPYPKRTTTAWPLDMEACSATPCKLADGTPGLACSAGQACFNPCPAGTGPERDHWSCAKLCKSNADCGTDPCRDGVCDRWPKHPCKDPSENCTTPSGDLGFRCSAKDKCLPMCKRGLVVYGGTHCAKACKSDRDCPGGSCSEDVCVPLCPSEGCPYRWE